MDTIIKQGHLIFGIAIMALGIEHLVCARYGLTENSVFPGEAVASVIPWVPGHAWLAYLAGVILILLSLSIITGIKARTATILLGILFLLPALLRINTIRDHRTAIFEMLAISGAALTLAGTLPAKIHLDPPWNSALNILIKSGRFFFAISSIVFGIDHFIFASFVASLIPAWIPWHLFWVYLTGAGFIAAGLAIATKIMGRLAGIWLGIMFLLWFLLLHSPRVLGLSAMAPTAPHNPNEWSSAFIALAMCGGYWICAWALSSESRESH